ncbi:MAG: type IV toxin-antitoxin system AbiEi family antitoxin [Candidatus Aenigmatarchaeota archaeon]
MNYKISEREGEIIEKVKDKDLLVFSPRDVRHIIDTSQENVHRILQNMKKKDLVISPERNKYVLKEKWDETDVYAIASNLFSPSYLALWSALHFHGMTEQVPQTVFLITTKRKRTGEIQNRKIRFVKTRKKDYFGYESRGNVIVSDREKTVIDCLRLPEYAGGIEHIYSCLDRDLNREKLTDYCKRIGSSSLASRLGYMLDKKGLKFPELKELVTTYSKLDPKGGRENPNSEWKIYANREI